MRLKFVSSLFMLLALTSGLNAAGVAGALPAGKNADEQGGARPLKDFRPPAVPLVVCDPYFSVWSMADQLTDDATRHWTGTIQTLDGMVRIDGKPYRFMGKEPRSVAAMRQMKLQVLPTRSIYEFEAGGINLALTFMTPLLPNNLDVLARPVTYLTWELKSVDGKQHRVSVYFAGSSELAVDAPEQNVVWARYHLDDLYVMRVGTLDQPVLKKFGDNLRIDWGYLYLCLPQGEDVKTAMTGAETARKAFTEGRPLPSSDDMRMPRPVLDETPVLAAVWNLGQVGAAPVSRYALLAYDDLFSIEYFYRKLRPYWRRKGAEVDDLLREAVRDYSSLSAQCRAFDAELMTDLRRVGGEKYARLAALAYRQAIAAHKLAADADGTALFFEKENFSGACIATVDVIYPAAPIFLLLSEDLMKASLLPVLQYASLKRWPFPFAPHDLGWYPLANGQTYGGGEKSETNQMPVEESGNMLLLMAAVAKIDGNTKFLDPYWPVLRRWAEYLKAKGLDPENQLCTDDFAGHLAHNANLSLKAILALDAYGFMCDRGGRNEEGAGYHKLAREYARQWMPLAADDDHYRLAFDRPGTWSQKYNLVWDRLLGFQLFPPEVARKELAFYLKKQNRYGLPLDNRETYTKLDWLLWTATLAESPADFDRLLAPAYDFADQSPSRVPLTDWYMTIDARQRGFQARSVVGGIYIKMLSDSDTWRKWLAKQGK